MTTDQLKAVFPHASAAFVKANAATPATASKPVAAVQTRQAAGNDAGAAKPFAYKSEKQFQQDAEAWLSARGYARLTSRTALNTSANQRGWFGHMADPRGNFFAPDLLIFDLSFSRVLPLELKSRPVYRPGQREMIHHERWVECRSLSEVQNAVTKWENEKK